MKRIRVVVLLWASLLSAGSGPKHSETLVITNVNVVDTRSGTIHSNMTVTINQGVITSVTKLGLVDAGPHVRMVNANGDFLLPGLWDMNTHLRSTVPGSSLRAALFEFYLANGVTGIRDLDIAASTTVPAASNLQPEIEHAKSAAPNPESAASAGWTSTRSSIEDLGEILSACSSPLQQAQVPAQNIENSALKLPAERYDPEIARKIFLQLSDHATWIVPSLVSRDAALQQRDLELVREMHRTGLQFLAGTNGFAGNLPSWLPVQRELELLVESGLSPLEALQAATFNPALYMTKLDKYGVVEPGHIADLVFLHGNPLQDIRNTRNIAGLMLRGEYLSRADLDGMLARARNEAHKSENSAEESRIKD